jgi:PAS domain S-box-containing protein
MIKPSLRMPAWASKTRVLLALVCVAIVLRIFTVYFVKTENNRIEAQFKELLLQVRLKETFESLTSSYNAAESAIRGYAIAGDKKFINYFNPALDSLNAQQKRFHQLLDNTGIADQKVLNDFHLWLDNDLVFLHQLKSACDAGQFSEARNMLTNEGESSESKSIIVSSRALLINNVHVAQQNYNEASNTSSWLPYLSFFSAVLLSLTVFFLLLIEIRRRKKLNAELQVRRKLLQTTFNSISEGLITTGVNGHILFMNSTAEILTGWKATEAKGERLETVYNIFNEQSGERQESIVARVLRTSAGIAWENNTILCSRDQVKRVISNNGAPTFDSNGKLSGSVLVFRDITHEKEEESRIAKATIQAQETERQQMGLELHDNINQILVGASLTLSMAKQTYPEKAIEFIQKSQGHISEAIDEIRKLSHRLTPASFAGIPLNEVFQSLIDGLNIQQKFNVSFYYDDLDVPGVTDEIRINLYRMLQEQLKNIVQYSEATAIEINLHLLDKRIRMTVIDNGKGFEPLLAVSGIGLNNIQKRASLLKGKFLLETAPGKGCMIAVEIPI